MSVDGGFFGDALLGTDGTAEPRARTRYLDALAQSPEQAEEWGSFALPRLPVAPGGDARAAAAAVVAADPLPTPGAPRRPPAPARPPAPRRTTAPQASSGGNRVSGWQAPTVTPRAQPGARPATIRNPSKVPVLLLFLLILLVGYLALR